MTESKRRGYKDSQKQMAANRRYMEKNSELKREQANYRSMKSAAKRFVTRSTDVDLLWLNSLVKEELNNRNEKKEEEHD